LAFWLREVIDTDGDGKPIVLDRGKASKLTASWPMCMDDSTVGGGAPHPGRFGEEAGIENKGRECSKDGQGTKSGWKVLKINNCPGSSKMRNSSHNIENTG
jgi:hypothetical protein